MKARDLILLSLALSCVACMTEPVLTTVSFGLDSVPEEVASISIFVRDIEKEEIVASSTVSGGQTTALLGVPAERALEFTAVAYTQSPGPASLLNMPVFVARNQSVIPLDRDRIKVPLNAVRAGVLTLRLTPPEDRNRLPDDLRLRLESEQGASNLLPLEIPENVEVYNKTLILPVGRYRAQLEEPSRDEARWKLRNREGIHIAAEFETITELKIDARVPDAAPPLPQLELQLRDSSGSTLADSFRLGPDLEYSIEPVFLSNSLAVQQIRSARWKIRAEPPGTMLGPQSETSADFADSSDLELILFTQGQGRAEINYEVKLADGRWVRASQNYIVVPEGVENSAATDLQLSIVSPSEIADGSELRIEILDKDGLYAQTLSGNIDLIESDDWLYLIEGPSLDLNTVQRSVSFRQISRLSGPRGIESTVRATLTSTNIPNTITSTLSIEPLSFD